MASRHSTTLPGSGLASILRRQARILAREWPAARGGRPRAVHRARVASRRLREALPIAGAGAPDEFRGAWRRVARQVTRALGTLREVDVALDLVDTGAAAHGWRAAAVAGVRGHLRRARKRRESDVRARAADLDVAALAKDVAGLAEAIEARPSGPWRRAIGGRLRKRARRLDAALERVGTLYAPVALHAVRIAAKKLRYTLELADQATGVSTQSLVGRLRRVQDLLGRLHDLQILQAYVHGTAVEMAGNVPCMRALEQIVADCEMECRDLHATFLRRRRRLAAVGPAVRCLAATDFIRAEAVRMSAAGAPRRVVVDVGRRAKG